MLSFDKLETLVSQAKNEYEELNGGKKVACMRLRKVLMDLKKMCHEMRKDVLLFKADMPKKERPKKIKECDTTSESSEESEESEPEKPKRVKKQK